MTDLPQRTSYVFKFLPGCCVLRQKAFSFVIIIHLILQGRAMKFFIDTANIDEIKKAWELGRH